MSVTTKKKNTTTEKNVTATIKTIRTLQQREGKSKLDLVSYRVEIGVQLQKLKELAGHGGWAEVREQAGYDERTAQRLMNLPGSAVDQIRATRPDLASKLPEDLRKLETLAKLTAEQLCEALATWYFDDMTREQIDERVKAVRTGKPLPEALDAEVDANADEGDDTEPTKAIQGVQRHDGGSQAKDGGADDDDTDDEDQDAEDPVDEPQGDDASEVDDEAGKQRIGFPPGSPQAKAVDEAAVKIKAQVIESIRTQVRCSTITNLLSANLRSEDFIAQITHRLLELLTAS